MDSFSQSVQGIEQAFEKQYYNIQFIGKGAFSNVFKAKNSVTHEVVAIKVMHLNIQVIDLTILDNDVIPYMKNEVDLLCKSKNENVIKLIDHKITDHTIFLILEVLFYLNQYCQLDVATMARKYFSSKVPEDLAIIIVRQIACGLHYLHENNIIHRDLKLENFAIQMTPEDYDDLTQKKDLQVFHRAQFKLIDLGLSKQFTSKNETTKTWAGSELSMAPEILEEKPYTLQADMYSFGVCIFLMVTGKFPYFEQSRRINQQDLIKQGNADFNAIQKPPLRELVRKMLIYDPEERLSWKEMYEHQYFTNTTGQIVTPLDLRLQQNSRIYKVIQPQYSEESKSQLQFVQNYIQKQQFENEEEEIQMKQELQFECFQQIYQSQSKINENSLNVYQPTKNENEKMIECLLIHSRFLLSVRAAQKLQSVIERVSYQYTKLWYITMGAEFGKYIDYLMQLGCQFDSQLQQKISSMENDYGIYQEFKAIKDKIKFDPLFQQFQQLKLMKPQANFWKKIGLFLRKQETTIICLGQNDSEYEKQLIEVNQQIYNLILRMLQDINFKIKNEEENYNEIKCLLYLSLINVARLKYVLINTKIEDQKLEELEIESYRNEPDRLAEKVTEILDKYKLIYEIQS